MGKCSSWDVAAGPNPAFISVVNLSRIVDAPNMHVSLDHGNTTFSREHVVPEIIAIYDLFFTPTHPTWPREHPPAASLYNIEVSENAFVQDCSHSISTKRASRSLSPHQVGAPTVKSLVSGQIHTQLLPFSLTTALKVCSP